MLAQRRRGRHPFHRRVGDRAEGAEVRVVEQALTLEAAHHTQDLAIALAARSDDELRGGARRRDPGTSLEPRLARQAPGQHEGGQQVAGVVLLARQTPHHLVVRPFEVDRHARRQARRGHHLLALRSGQHLDVHVAAEALALPQDLHRREHAVHRPRGPAGHAGGEEEPLGDAGPVRFHERARDLLRGERGALDAAAAEGRAVAAGQRAGVGLHDPHEGRRAAPRHADGPEAHGTLDGAGVDRQAGLAVVRRRLAEDPEALGPVHGVILNTRRGIPVKASVREPVR